MDNLDFYRDVILIRESLENNMKRIKTSTPDNIQDRDTRRKIILDTFESTIALSEQLTNLVKKFEEDWYEKKISVSIPPRTNSVGDTSPSNSKILSIEDIKLISLTKEVFGVSDEDVTIVG